MLYVCGMSCLLGAPLLRADSRPAFSISSGMNVGQASSCWQSLKSELKCGKWAGTNSSGLCRKEESELIDLCSSFSLSPSEVPKAIKRERSAHKEVIIRNPWLWLLCSFSQSGRDLGLRHKSVLICTSCQRLCSRKRINLLIGHFHFQCLFSFTFYGSITNMKKSVDEFPNWTHLRH